MQSKEIRKILLKSTAIFILIFSAVVFIGLYPTITAQAEENEVYLGGFPIGIRLQSNGLIVEEFRPIITGNGNFTPAKDSGIMIGDMLISANGTTLNSPKDLQNALGKQPSIITIKLLRGSEELKVNVTSIFDPIAGAAKLGLIVKNDVAGLGTMTYVDKNGNFCALGHKISDTREENYIRYQNGDLFEAIVLGVYRGKDGEAGALKGTFDKNGTVIGKINKNSPFGTYGNLNEASLFASRPSVKLGSKSDVTLGKAYIYSTLEGKEPTKYQIEIVKAMNQNSPEVKSMVIRVTDKRLLENSGGIVQGMSGSPIVQNGKLIGAVTHVFLSDASIGYGVYIDWLV